MTPTEDGCLSGAPPELILGQALAVVLVSGSVFSAHSETVIIERDSSGN